MQLKASLRGHDYATQVQMLTPKDGSAPELASVHEAAAHGISGGGGKLPDAAKIQQSFGGYDISNIQAHADGPAAEANRAMGANAYTSGNQIALGDSGKDLHTQAHEATHVVQQQRGVALSGGVGQANDVYEKQANAVGDRVVQGKSAEDLLSQIPGGTGKAGVQQDVVQQQKGEENDTAPTKEAKIGVTQNDLINSEVNQAKDALNNAYVLRRQQALVALRSQLLGADAAEPSLATSVIVAAATAALAVATGGISTIVAKLLVGVGKDALSTVATASIKGAVDAALAAGVKATAATLPAASDESSIDAFIFLQEEALGKLSLETLQGCEELRLNLFGRPGDEGVLEARRLKEAANAGALRARGLQFQASLAEWANTLDKGSKLTGRDHYGGGLASMDTTAPGILGIDLDISSPDAPLTITGAHLEGISSRAREALLRESAEGATIKDMTPAGAGMTIRAIQQGHAPGLFGSAENKRVRVPLESTPSRRNQLIPGPVTGSEGMFLIDRVRKKHGVSGFGEPGYEYGVTPIGAQVIWEREIAMIPLKKLPVIGG